MVQINSLNELAKKMEKDLQKNILPFWIKSIDDKFGGFYGAMDLKGNPIENSSKGLVLNARILWTFSHAYRIYKDNEYLKIANYAFKYITKYFWDKDYTGGYWELNYNNSIKNAAKITYAQAFLLYAFSEYAMANSSSKNIEWADAVYFFIEKNCKKNNYYLEMAESDNEKTSPLVSNNEKFSMNTYLHVMESITNYYKINQNETIKNNLINLINLFLKSIYNEETKHCDLFFSCNMKPISKKVSYGHDIETSWLLVEAAKTLYLFSNKEKKMVLLLKKCKKVAREISESIYRESLDSTNTSLFNEGSLDGEIIDYTKVWWAQAEGVVGFVNAWQITGEGKYLKTAKKIWKYIEKQIINNDKLEWLATGRDSIKDKNSQYLINFWKCPYHNSRAAFEIKKRSENLK